MFDIFRLLKFLYLFLAFREVFDLFDCNGGGTIDAEELDLALKSVDIQLSQEDLHEVISAMDKNGKLLWGSLGCNEAGDELSWRNELREEWVGKRLLPYSLRGFTACLGATLSAVKKSLKC